jgi:hypothetical protein
MLIQLGLQLTFRTPLSGPAAWGKADVAPSEGVAIAQVGFASDEQVFASGVEESLEDGEIASRQRLTLLAVAVVALALGLLPAVVSLAIVLGRTVPLEFGAGAGLALVAGFKVCAGAWGLVEASRARRPAVPVSFLHL